MADKMTVEQALEQLSSLSIDAAELGLDTHMDDEAIAVLRESINVGEQCYLAAFFAEGFVRHADGAAQNPKLAKECEEAIAKAIAAYRALYNDH